MKKISLILFFIILCSVSISAQQLRVRVFSQQKIKQTSFVPSFGRYSLEIDGNLTRLSRTSNVKLSALNGKVEVRINDSVFANSEKSARAYAYQR